MYKAKSDKYGGWSKTAILLCSRYSWTMYVICSLALSWWNPSIFQFRSLFVDMPPRCFQHPKVVLLTRNFLPLIFLSGTTCWQIIPFWFQNVIMILPVDFHYRTFFQHGCSFHFEISLYCFDSESNWWIHISRHVMTQFRNVKSSSKRLRMSFTSSIRWSNWNRNYENNHSQFLAILRYPLKWVHWDVQTYSIQSTA